MQPPVVGHAANQIGLDGYEAEERRREVAALMPRTRRLQLARIPSAFCSALRNRSTA
jgi:hypothetical protein